MFIGQTRFSLFVPQSGSWRASNGKKLSSEADYRAYLYDPQRMEFRTNHFIEHTVPLLAQAARGHEVTHIVSFSESLPQRWKSQLEKAGQQYDFLWLDERKDGEQAWDTPQAVIRASGHTGVYGSYRLDDDDMLATGFFDAAQPYLVEPFVEMFVSFPLGVEAIFDGTHFSNFRLAHVPMNSMGLMALCSIDAEKNIRAPKGGPHDLTDRYSPVILDARHVSYLRSLHDGQDNAMRYRDGSVLERLLHETGKNPPLHDYDQLASAFPTVAERIDQGAQNFAVGKTVGDGVAFALAGQGAQGAVDATIVLSLNSEKPIEPENFVVDLLVVDAQGRKVPRHQAVAGLKSINRGRIGHCHLVPVEEGQSRVVVSLRLEQGKSLLGFCIKGLEPKTQKVSLETVSVAADAAFHPVDAARFAALVDYTPLRVQDRFLDFLVDRRESIHTVTTRVLGQQSAERALAKLLPLYRRIRRLASH